MKFDLRERAERETAAKLCTIFQVSQIQLTLEGGKSSNIFLFAFGRILESVILCSRASLSFFAKKQNHASFHQNNTPEMFRFLSRKQLHEKLVGFQIQVKVVTEKRAVFSGGEILLLSLHRLTVPSRLCEFRHIFGLNIAVAS
jgi:hypothetical protein